VGVGLGSRTPTIANGLNIFVGYSVGYMERAFGRIAKEKLKCVI